MQLILELNRRIYSKKNSRRVIKRGNRRFFVPSEAFSAFEIAAVADIQEQMAKILKEPYFKGKVRVHTDFFVPGKLRVDGDNLHTSILDVLQKAKVIDDDESVLEGSYKKYPDSPGWGAIIKISSM